MIKSTRFDKRTYHACVAYVARWCSANISGGVAVKCVIIFIAIIIVTIFAIITARSSSLRLDSTIII